MLGCKQKDDEDEGRPVLLKMILKAIINNMEKQITDLQSLHRNTNTKFQQMETRLISDQSCNGC